MDNKHKYLKYKLKYLRLKKEIENKQMRGGAKENNNSKDNSKKEVYLFKAEWCGHCKNFLPVWNELINSEYKNKYNFITKDSEKDNKDIMEWNIRGYPTIMLKNKNTITEYSGARDLNSLKKWLDTN